jgi:hypothetical protein
MKKLEDDLKRENISGRLINNALMDFGATYTTFEKMDRLSYPLLECVWFETRGKRETVEKKIPKRSKK